MEENIKQTNTWAILSLVFAFVFAPLGIIFGIVALNKIKNNPSLDGKGLAIAGIILGSIFMIIPLLFFVGSIAYFGVLSPEQLVPERTSFSAPFPSTEAGIISSTDNTVKVVLQNNMGQKIKILEEGSCNGIPSTITSSKIDVLNGEKFILTFNCEIGKVGSRFDGQLSFKYETLSGLTKTHTGSISGKVN